MPFDSHAYTDALTPPAIVIGGQTHTGRLLSAFEYQDALEWAKQVEDLAVPRAEREAMALKVISLIFPPEVAAAVVALPAESFWKAWAYFFICQRRPASEGETPAPQ